MSADDNTIEIGGNADINIGDDIDFDGGDGNNILVTGSATVDVEEEVQLDNEDSNQFIINGNSRVTIMDGSSDPNDEEDAVDDYFTVTGGGYLKLGDLGPILPVELIEFKGGVEEGKIVLNWSTASEKNNDYFELLKSEDGVTFSPIGKISGNGTSNSINHYAFIDRHPKSGNNYYQLRQVDYDGKSESFPIILVIYGSASELVSHMVVWPNPVTDRKFNIAIDNLQITGIPTISLIDLQGRVLLKESFSPNSNSIFIDASNSRIHSGTYILEYHNGMERIRKRIVMN